MPLFGKKHKSPRRKLEAGSANAKSTISLTETSHDPNDPNSASVKLKLGGNELIFQDGEWYSDATSSGGKGSLETSKLHKQNTQLKEENNYLKYKIEVLLDMLAATTADCNVVEKELDILQNQKRNRGVQR